MVNAKIMALQPADETSYRFLVPSAGTAWRIVFYLGLLAAWEAVVALLDVPRFVVPAPSEIIANLWNGLVGGDYLKHAAITVLEMLAGFLIAVLLGLSIGIAVVESKFVDQAIYPLIFAFQSVPKVALAPLILIWTGFGLSSKITLAALVAFFPILVNTIVGLRSYERDMDYLFRGLAATRYQKLIYMKLPVATPYIVAGLDIGLTFSLLGAVVGEFLGANAGLGYVITQAQFRFDTAAVFATLILLGVIGVLGHAIVGLLGKRVAFWHAGTVGQSGGSR